MIYAWQKKTREKYKDWVENSNETDVVEYTKKLIPDIIGLVKTYSGVKPKFNWKKKVRFDESRLIVSVNNGRKNEKYNVKSPFKGRIVRFTAYGLPFQYKTYSYPFNRYQDRMTSTYEGIGLRSKDKIIWFFIPSTHGRDDKYKIHVNDGQVIDENRQLFDIAFDWCFALMPVDKDYYFEFSKVRYFPIFRVDGKSFMRQVKSSDMEWTGKLKDISDNVNRSFSLLDSVNYITSGKTIEPKGGRENEKKADERFVEDVYLVKSKPNTAKRDWLDRMNHYLQSSRVGRDERKATYHVRNFFEKHKNLLLIFGIIAVILLIVFLKGRKK